MVIKDIRLGSHFQNLQHKSIWVIEDHLHLNYYPGVPPAVPPVPPVLPPAPPAQPAVPLGPMPQLNWSNFKPEFAGKPDEDAEAHLLNKNDWMDTHAFPEGVKVQRFCLTLVGEARLWYESL